MAGTLVSENSGGTARVEAGDFGDNTGKNGRCTYSADWFHSLPFSLTGNGSYDLLIVPSVPEGRGWTVTVNCDNGSATTVTKFYSAPVGRKAAP